MSELLDLLFLEIDSVVVNPESADELYCLLVLIVVEVVKARFP